MLYQSEGMREYKLPWETDPSVTSIQTTAASIASLDGIEYRWERISANTHTTCSNMPCYAYAVTLYFNMWYLSLYTSYVGYVELVSFKRGKVKD